jgi:hypothetical protein
MERLAADMANSGLFGFKTKQEAMSIMMIAQAEGKHPATAARDYDVINKKLAKRAEAMMRDFMEGGGKVKWNALTDELADATFSHPQGGEVRISWDMARALQAGLSSKENWRKYPRQMLRNRTVSEGVRTVWPLATSGMYERGEVEDFTGKTVDGTAEEQPSLDRRLSLMALAEVDAARRQAMNDAIPLKAVAARTPPAERKAGPVEYDADPAEKPQRTDEQWRVWIDKLRAACATLKHRQEVVEIGNKQSVGDAIATAPDWAQREISAILAENYARFPAEPGDDLDEVVIAGEAKLAAG